MVKTKSELVEALSEARKDGRRLMREYKKLRRDFKQLQNELVEARRVTDEKPPVLVKRSQSDAEAMAEMQATIKQLHRRLAAK